MFRQYFLTFTGKPRDQHAYEHAHEVPWQMLAPLVILGTLAVVGGGFGGWFGEMNPMRSGAEQIAALDNPGQVAEMPAEAHATGAHNAHDAHDAHAAHTTAMRLSTLLGLSGILLGALMYLQKKDGRTVFNPAIVAKTFRPIHVLLSRKYYLDEIYMAAFVMSTRMLGRFSAVFDRRVIDAIVNFFGIFGVVWAFITEWLDRLLVDGLFVNGAAKAAVFAGDRLAMAQTGRVRQYLVLTVAGLVVISGLCMFLLLS
jgi:NADH-quinone oxidoreductase subunit L